MATEFETKYGSLHVEPHRLFAGEHIIEIHSENYPECEQRATLTIEQFGAFIAKCQEIYTTLCEQAKVEYHLCPTCGSPHVEAKPESESEDY